MKGPGGPPPKTAKASPRAPSTGDLSGRDHPGIVEPGGFSFPFLRFLLRCSTHDGCAGSPALLLEQRRAARDDAAEKTRRRARVIFFLGRPLRDHLLNNILLQLQHICSACSCGLGQRAIVHGAADLLLRRRHLQQARPGRDTLPTGHILRHHRRSRPATAFSRPGCRSFAPAPLLAGMRPSDRAEPRVDRRPAKDRRQGVSASMHVHVSERSMGQERAREGHHV